MSISTDNETRYKRKVSKTTMKSTPSATDVTLAVDRLHAGITPMGYMIIITNMETRING